MRAAIFYSPPPHHALTVAAARWLGRDAFENMPRQRPALPEITDAEHAALTASPRRYGFHATLKAPFRLAEPESLTDLEEALSEFATSVPPAPIGPVEITRIGSFFALTPRFGADRADTLAGRIVREFDRFRAPLSDVDLLRRDPEKLTKSQHEHLFRWGYPYVLSDYRFHMTLTGDVPAARRNEVEGILKAHFGALLEESLSIDSLALFIEENPGADFVVRRFFPMERSVQSADVA